MSNEEYSTNQSGHRVKTTTNPDGTEHYSLANEPKVENVVKIEVTRDKELERLQIENTDLTTKLAIIAEKEFSEKSEKISQELGINKSDISPENFKAFKTMAEKKAQERDASEYKMSTAYLNEFAPNQQTNYKLDDSKDLPIDMLSFDSTEEAIAELERRSKNGDAISKQYLSQLIKSTFGKSATWEYRGKSSLSLVKDPIPILPTDSDSVKQYKKKKNAELMKDKLSWVKVE